MVDKTNLLQRLMWICNTLFHQTFAAVSVYILWILFYYSHTEDQFSWHLYLSTLAYVPLMGEAIILFSGDNVWSQKLDRTIKYWIHGFLLFASFILVTVGIAMIYDQKASGTHFISDHAWTGLVSWIFILLSQIFGMAAAKAQAFKFIKPVIIKLLHNVLGLLGYYFGMASLIYGLDKGSFKAYSTADSRVATAWVLGVTTVWSSLAAFQSAYNQIRAIIA